MALLTRKEPFASIDAVRGGLAYVDPSIRRVELSDHAGALSLTQGTFFGLGAYAAGILASRFGWPMSAHMDSRSIRPN